MNQTSSTSHEAQGWWIGLKLKLKKEALKCNKTNNNFGETITAIIHDYNHQTQESQIWINTENNTTCIDYINLNSTPPTWYTVIGTILSNKNLWIPSNNEWIPMKLELGCCVEINNMKGTIDAYDYKSRRYHVSYNNNMSEWFWCNSHNTKVCDTKIHTIHHKICTPPFDVSPYGLTDAFLSFSNTMSRKRNIHTINDENANNNQPPTKKRKVETIPTATPPPLPSSPSTATATATAASIIRIPKMTEKRMQTIEKREIITISSQSLSATASATPPKLNSKKHPCAEVINLVDDEEEIVVGTAQYREYNRQLLRREKEKRRRRKKERRQKARDRSKHKAKSKGSSLYPRKTRIKGVKWKRKYAAEEKRYYWVQKKNEDKSSWNPYRDAGLLAPWLKGRADGWEKWYDEDSKKYYYYHRKKEESTFERPMDYRSPQEIGHDSVDDDYKAMQPIYNDPHNDDELQVLGMSNALQREKVKNKNKNNNKSRRYSYCDPNAGGFSFAELPKVAVKVKEKLRVEDDMSLLQAVSGLEDILNGNIKQKVVPQAGDQDMLKANAARRDSIGAGDSSGSVDVEGIFGVDGDREKAARYDTNEIVKACWKLLERKVRKQPKIKFNELISTHASGWNLDDNVINALRGEYNQTIVDIFQNCLESELRDKTDQTAVDIDINSGLDTATQKNVWAQLDENLRSLYKSQNVKAIHFVAKVFADECKDGDAEQKAKCLSILNQNSNNLVRILKSDRKGFINDITRILFAVVKGCQLINDDEMDIDVDMESKVDIDVVFGAFGYGFIDEYMYSLIKYQKSHSETIKMMMLLAKSCVVYQLIGCNRMLEIMDRWNILKLLKVQSIFSNSNSNKKMEQDDEEEGEQEMSASILLSIEVLRLVNILTTGISSYRNVTKLQKDCIDDIQQNTSNYMLRGFPLDLLYNVISGVLKYNLLSIPRPNIILFELCCNILTNAVSINEPIILKILDVSYKRSKRVIYLLHKTYTELISGKKRRKAAESSSSDDSFYNNDSDGMGSPRARLKQVIQPYEFKNFDDASYEPYGIELDVSQREDPKNLSNIDCRESIGDILLRYLERMANNNSTFSKITSKSNIMIKYKALIGNLFYSMLESAHLVKVSWGYNKALNHYHRDNTCIEWIKAELLYQHTLDGREHPDKNNQPERHFRICSLVEILFDPLVCDHNNYIVLLQKLCHLCQQYKQKTNLNLNTWKKLKNNNCNANHSNNNSESVNVSVNEAESMNFYITNLWNDIAVKYKNISSKQTENIDLNKNDLVFVQLLHECVNNESDSDKKEEQNIVVADLCNNFEKMLRGKSREILSNRGTTKSKTSIDSLISIILRSNTLHLLVGLTQMEATSAYVRNCARRAIRCIVWSVSDKYKIFFKKSQIPFLPTITHQYKTYLQPANLIHTKKDRILVVGDGNLSFGRALSRLFGAPQTKTKLHKLRKTNQNNGDENGDIDYGARNVVVTCYESAMELLARYPHSGSVVAEIVNRGSFVLYGVDATDLKKTLTNSFITYGGDKRAYKLFEDINSFPTFKYEIIIWNFPHAMDRSYKPQVNGDLVEAFFVSAKEILTKNGEIHVTLHINHQIDDEIGKKAAMNRTYHQYLTWGIGHRADLQDLRCIKHIELKHRLYPGYAIKNVQGNPFNIVKAETYIFKRNNDLKDL